MRTALVVALIVLAVGAEAAAAQEPAQVTGLGVRQADGFATLSWIPVAGATDYQIERTPVGSDNVATAPAAIVGVWRPNRTVTPERPTFADAGFNPGDRFQWRVRARTGTTEHPYSEPVFGTTDPPWGDPSFRTQWELTQAAQYTSDVDEYQYTAAVDEASDRVRVVEIGRTLLGRPINMFVIGYPKPPGKAKQVARETSALVNCNVHGNEPSSREACLIMAREFGLRARSPHDRHPAPRDGADRPVDQRGRPRGEHARQLDRAGPQSRLLADPSAGDVLVREDDARLRPGGGVRRPRVRQQPGRRPARAAAAAPERRAVDLRRVAQHDRRLDVRPWLD